MGKAYLTELVKARQGKRKQWQSFFVCLIEKNVQERCVANEHEQSICQYITPRKQNFCSVSEPVCFAVLAQIFILETLCYDPNLRGFEFVKRVKHLGLHG